MRDSQAIFRVGARSSPLSQTQTQDALARLAAILPGCSFEMVPCESPGDRDGASNLTSAPADFFTRDLDEAVRDGRVDLAIHSAKDMPSPAPYDLDWCWLPWREDRREALVLRSGESVANLPEQVRFGVNSDRREAWCRERFPKARILPIRGNIDGRIRQLDEGDYDVLVLAGAALNRLGLQARISEWIPLADLPTPEGQGALGMTFRRDNPSLHRIRSLLLNSIVFVGAGPGDAGLCTVAGVQALQRCNVCLYDALVDPSLLATLPAGALAIDVGKRCGRQSKSQDEICALLADYGRRGARVVRLKGGDPGIFGRLAEETEWLDGFGLPYRVVPGVSSLNAATTGTGMLLTRRGESRGFCVVTPRACGGDRADVSAPARAAFPMAFFMAISSMAEVIAQLLVDGRRRDELAAVVFAAGTPNETVVSGCLDDIVPKAREYAGDAPGLLLVGDVTRCQHSRSAGAFAGRRVLLTCSGDLQDEARERVVELGGFPVSAPLTELVLEPGADAALARLGEFDWVALTSPVAARMFMRAVVDLAIDVRRIPKIIAGGPRTAAELEPFGISADVVPESDLGAPTISSLAETCMRPGARVLRPRSDRAGTDLALRLQELGMQVADTVLYSSAPTDVQELPDCEAVLFASGSAVDVFVEKWGAEAMQARLAGALGSSTARAIARSGQDPVAVSLQPTIEDAVTALAGLCVASDAQNCCTQQEEDDHVPENAMAGGEPTTGLRGSP